MGYFQDDDDAVAAGGVTKTATGKTAMRVKTACKKRRAATKQERATADYLLNKLKDMPDVREELVQRVRREIAEGSYETPERVESAINGLLRELFENDDTPGSD